MAVTSERDGARTARPRGARPGTASSACQMEAVPISPARPRPYVANDIGAGGRTIKTIAKHTSRRPGLGPAAGRAGHLTRNGAAPADGHRGGIGSPNLPDA